MSDLTFTSSEKAYLKTQLNRVARTFALLPPFLDDRLGAMMSAAYLVCRVVDSIEDCTQPFDWKQARFAEVRRLLQEPAAMDEILGTWNQLAWPGLNADEIDLVQTTQGKALWQIYARIPDRYRKIIRTWVTEMADGMENTLNPATSPHVIQDGNLQILSDLEDYNRYCYYVAGTVGHLQTELLQAFYDFPDEVIEALRRYSLAFGLALQKTNIIKDFLDDYQRGIVYLPYAWLVEIQKRPLAVAGATPRWIGQVLLDVKLVLDEAVEYISCLPYKVNGVRQSTLMCLLPAYQTILLAARHSKFLFTPNHQVKISKQVLAVCYKDARMLAADNRRLQRYRDRMHEQLVDLLGDSQNLPPEALSPFNA